MLEEAYGYWLASDAVPEGTPDKARGNACS